MRKHFKNVLKKTLSVALAVALFACTIPFAMQSVEAAQPNQPVLRNVVYYGDWSVWGGQGMFFPQNIPAELITHLNFAFLYFDRDGNLRFTDEDAAVGHALGQAGVQWGAVNAGILPALIDLRAQNPNMRIGVSVGGWSKSANFTPMTLNPVARANFVNNLMSFVEYTDMDFIDLDWEFPGDVRQPDLVDNRNDQGTPYSVPEDRENWVILLREIREALDELGERMGKHYELSIALPVNRAKLQAGVDIPGLFEIVCFANMMTYDMRGAWDSYSGHHTNLFTNPLDPHADLGFSVHDTVQYILSYGIQADKITVGYAAYSRGWGRVGPGPDPNLPGLFGYAERAFQDADGSPSRGASNQDPLVSGEGGRRGGIWAVRSLDLLQQRYPGLQEFWDDVAQAPFMSSPCGAFITFDNERSVTAKAEYVLEHGLGGMILWMSSQDRPSNPANDVRDALTRAATVGMFGTTPLPVHDIVYRPQDISVDVRLFEQAWGSGGFEITITNNERLVQTNTVLRATEEIAKTIMTPTVIIQTDGSVNITSGDHAAGTVRTEGNTVIVNLGEVFNARLIEPGTSYTFGLNTSTVPASVDVIESIEMTQRIHANGAEIRRQTLLGSGDVVVRPPTISGAANVTLAFGSSFDPLQGVTATDRIDGDITSRIVVTGTVDTHTAGVYTLVYTVENNAGLTATVERNVTVLEADQEPPVNDNDTGNDVGNDTGNDAGNDAGNDNDSGGTDPGDPRAFDINAVYVAGDIVVFNGAMFRARWWITGEYPHQSEAWERLASDGDPTIPDWVSGRAYTQGERVMFQGNVYEARWWTTATPGTCESRTRV
jgi:chitinase